MNPSRAFRIIVSVVLLLVGESIAWAHSMFQSAVMLDFHSSSVEVRLELPPSRLDKAFGQVLTRDNLVTLESQLEPYITSRVQAKTSDGGLWTVRVEGPLSWEVVDDVAYVVAHLSLTPPRDNPVRRFTFEDDVITDALAGQVVLVSVSSDWKNGTFANDPELLGVLTSEERTIEIDRGDGSWTRGFSSVFRLGTRHIAEGTDHLLFLLALLLPAPLLRVKNRWGGFAGIRHGFTQILKVVTAFTIGHSLTLALAASGIVHVPGRPIEVLIAVSILISAVHAMRPMFPGKEAVIAAGFGLIHGLAFASTLAALGLRSWERLQSIFAFNIGIEAMQLVVVLCVMPSLMLLSQTKVYPWFRSIGASFAAIASAGWIVERSFNSQLGVDRVVDAIAKDAPVVAGLLFLGAVVCFFTRPLHERAVTD